MTANGVIKDGLILQTPGWLACSRGKTKNCSGPGIMPTCFSGFIRGILTGTIRWLSTLIIQVFSSQETIYVSTGSLNTQHNT
jgi:hypothetical protein